MPKKSPYPLPKIGGREVPDILREKTPTPGIHRVYEEEILVLHYPGGKIEVLGQLTKRAGKAGEYHEYKEYSLDKLEEIKAAFAKIHGIDLKRIMRTKPRP